METWKSIWNQFQFLLRANSEIDRVRQEFSKEVLSLKVQLQKAELEAKTQKAAAEAKVHLSRSHLNLLFLIHVILQFLPFLSLFQEKQYLELMEICDGLIKQLEKPASWVVRK